MTRGIFSRSPFRQALVALSMTLVASVAFGAPRGGGGFGGGGFRGGGLGGIGGGGMRLGGGGGSAFRGFGGGPSFGGGLRMSPNLGSGSRLSPGIGSGLRLSPGINNGLRMSPGLGSAPRLSPSLGSNLRLSPGTNALRTVPNIGRTPSLGSGGLNLPRQGITSLRPSINAPLSSRILSSPGTNSRTTLGGQGTSGLRLGNGSLANLGRAAVGSQTNLGQRGVLPNAVGANGTASLRLPFAGRVTPSQLGDFLSLAGRGPVSGGGSLRGAPGLNVSSLARTGAIGTSNFRNLQLSQINRINNNLNVSFRNTAALGVGRINNGFGFGFNHNPHWNNWAGGVRGYCNFNRFNNCFTPRFWATNFCHFPFVRSHYWWGARPWTHWWGCPTWGGLAGWFPSWGWTTPFYYGYGPGGNIIYQNGYVYMNDQPIATAEEFAASAAELADVPAPANPDQATDWMPLGTFALSEGENDKDPSRVVQLAVDKDGNISGTMTNQKTNQTLPIQGRVDKETQRVAFTIGDNKDVVLETGIFNLTQQQTPVLAHGDGREETYLMLRLDPPKTDDAKLNQATPPAPSKPLLP